MSLEWQLDKTHEEVGSYHFQNVNPKKVFVLALAAGFVSVCSVFFAYEIIQSLMAYELITSPPAISEYVR